MSWWLYAAATGLSVLSSLRASEAAADAMREQAEIAELQGEFQLLQAERQAEVEQEAGRERAQAIRRASRRAVGQQTSQVAASGLDLSGSPLLAIGDRIYQDEISASHAITNAYQRATRARLAGEAAKATGEAQASRLEAEARDTEISGWLEAVTVGFSQGARWHMMTRVPGADSAEPTAPYGPGSYPSFSPSPTGGR